MIKQYFCLDCKKEIQRRSIRCNSCAQKERFKNGAWNKGKKRYWNSSTQWVKGDKRISGENAYQWKENGFTSTALHNWVKKHLGKAKECVFCKTKTAKRYEWANKSEKYKRELSDWLELCSSCHKKYDIKMHRILGINSFMQRRFI